MTVRPPTLREKRRYILAGILPAGVMPEPKVLYFAISDACTALWGDAVTAVVQPAVISAGEGFAVIRCRRGLERELSVALSAVTACGGEPIALRTLATSGTIESLRVHLSRKGNPVSDEGAGRECTFDTRTWAVIRWEGVKVDVFEKGFKNAARFYLTTEDLEDS